ncbi:MAG TPA: hypothetical protein VN622_06005 [Clostridia bacterium]|nr:hypothetical protein [Clostridia bacterium]
MKELLEKLTSYNIFNCLLPGIVFAVLATKLTRYSFIQSDIAMGVFVYYFIGLVISRLGSLILEPFLKGIKFVRFAKYEEFLSAKEKDSTLDTLSETNNSYRTFCAVFSSLLLLSGYEKLEAKMTFLSHRGSFIIVVLLFVMFLFAYRKQTAYIVKRVARQSERGKATSA